MFNQFTEMFGVLELAERLAGVARDLGLPVEIAHVENPRVERESHYTTASTPTCATSAWSRRRSPTKRSPV